MDEFLPLNLFDDEETATETVEEPIEKNTEEVAQDENGEAVEKEAEETVEEPVEESAEEVAEEETVETVEETIAELLEEVIEESQPDKIDLVVEMQQQLSEKIESLRALFNARIMHTDHEEKIVDQMHKELQKYKEDMYAQLVRPILLDVIEVRDSILRMAATYLAKPQGEQSIPNKTFADYSYDLQDILEKNDVEIYRSKSGDDFTPIKQRVVKKVVTDDKALHGKIAESMSCGYSYNGKTISAEKITIYYYEEPVQKEEEREVIENG